MRIYFDCCALCRLTDDLNQPRLRAEAEAIERILSKVIAGEAVWVTSSVLLRELSFSKSPEQREFMLGLLQYANDYVDSNDMALARAEKLTGLGYGATDALHICR